MIQITALATRAADFAVEAAYINGAILHIQKEEMSIPLINVIQHHNTLMSLLKY